MSLPTAKVQETLEVKTNYLVTYPVYHIKPINLSSRSSLYNLEPQGLETSYVESLTSYIQRLATAHCVANGTLISKILAPTLNRKSKDLAMVCSSSSGRAINGIGKISLDMLEALEVLTLRSDLQYLTLQSFAEIIQSRNLCRPVKSWCPICLEEWRNTKHEIYEPLLWSIQIVKLCPIHLHPLCEYCPHCSQSQIPIAWYSRPGYCSKCYCWLGQNNPSDEFKVAESLEAQESSYIKDVRNICNLLSNSKKLSNFLSKESVRQALSLCIGEFANGSSSELGRLVGKSSATILGWKSGRTLPSLESLSSVCSRLNLLPTDLLTQKFTNQRTEQALEEEHQESSSSISESPIYEKSKFSSKTKPTSNKCTRPNVNKNSTRQFAISQNKKQNRQCKKSAEELEAIQDYLESLIKEKSFQPLDKIAKEIRTSHKTLRTYFSHLCDQISEGYAVQRTEQKADNLRLEFENLISEECDSLPTLKRISGVLKTSQGTLKHLFPDLCNKLKERRENHQKSTIEQKFTQVRSLLEQVLQENTEPPPSLKEVAEKYGYYVQTFNRYAPDLCKQISSRYLAYQKRRREMNIKQACDEVRKITLELYFQGIYPTSSQVRKFMTSSGYLREEEVVDAWKAALKEICASETEKH